MHFKSNSDIYSLLFFSFLKWETSLKITDFTITTYESCVFWRGKLGWNYYFFSHKKNVLTQWILVYMPQSSEHRCTPVFHRDFWEISMDLDSGIVDSDSTIKWQTHKNVHIRPNLTSGNQTFPHWKQFKQERFLNISVRLLDQRIKEKPRWGMTFECGIV